MSRLPIPTIIALLTTLVCTSVATADLIVPGQTDLVAVKAAPVLVDLSVPKERQPIVGQGDGQTLSPIFASNSDSGAQHTSALITSLSLDQPAVARLRLSRDRFHHRGPPKQFLTVPIRLPSFRF